MWVSSNRCLGGPVRWYTHSHPIFFKGYTPMGFGISFIFSLLAGATGGELLNYIDTATYWQTEGVAEVSVESMTGQLVEKQVEPDKIDERAVAILIDQLGSADFDEREQASAKLIAMGKPILPHLKKATENDDAEVALRAENIIKKIRGTSDEGDTQRVRRLMAIRTLGELKDKAAIPVLDKLKQSDRPFEAELAQRAIDQINGKAYQPPKLTRKQLDADLALLPTDVGVVGQMTGVSGRSTSLDEMFEGIALPDGIEIAQVKQELNKAMVAAVAHAGNVRLDAITLGVSAPIGPREGFVVVVSRLKYDRPALEAMLKAKSRDANALNDRIVYRVERDMGLILIDDGRIMMVAGENVEPAFEKMTKLIGTGKQTLTDNKDMTKLIAGVDKTADVWAVSKIDPSYKMAPFMQAFDTATLTGKRDENGNTKMTLTAVGTDAEQVGASVEMINQLIAQGKEELKQAADTPMGAMVKPYQAMLDSLKVAHDGGTMTMTGEMSGDGAGYILSPLMMTMSMRQMHTIEEQDVPNPPPGN
jgi:hypothetical protein